MRVAVIGLGGLGHLAVQFAAHMGARARPTEWGEEETTTAGGPLVCAREAVLLLLPVAALLGLR